MTLEEWFAKYFAPEYLNVQDKEDWTKRAKAELQHLLAPKSRTSPK